MSTTYRPATPGASMTDRPTAGIGPVAVALVLAGAAAVTLAAVWILQSMGYVPCELCLAERIPYYIAVPLALATAVALRLAPRLGQAGLVLLALLFLGGAGLAAYHAGVEWTFWPGPSGCSGSLSAPTSVDDFMTQLQSVKVVRCDAPALVVLGLSLAGWNVPLSLVLSAAALVGVRRVVR